MSARFIEELIAYLIRDAAAPKLITGHIFQFDLAIDETGGRVISKRSLTLDRVSVGSAVQWLWKPRANLTRIMPETARGAQNGGRKRPDVR